MLGDWVDAVKEVFQATALGKGLQHANSPRRSFWMVFFSVFADTLGTYPGKFSLWLLY